MRATARLSTTVDSYADLIINVHAQAGGVRALQPPYQYNCKSVGASALALRTGGGPLAVVRRSSGPSAHGTVVRPCRPKREEERTLDTACSHYCSPLISGKPASQKLEDRGRVGKAWS